MRNHRTHAQRKHSTCDKQTQRAKPKTVPQTKHTKYNIPPPPAPPNLYDTISSFPHPTPDQIVRETQKEENDYRSPLPDEMQML